MQIRKIVAIITAKASIYLSRIFGFQGSSFPGMLARKIYPPILTELAAGITSETIIITGTNGKTTTANMIACILRRNQNSYVHNQAGANMLAGITTAFIEQTNFNGKRKFDFALLETDEANVPLLLKEIKADCLLITNFFRDQLDRYGELDRTIELIKNAVKGSKLELVLNADDPLQVQMEEQSGLNCHYYGFAASDYDVVRSSENREGRYCIFCGEELVYTRYHYAQLGQFNCPRCHSHNHQADFTGDDLVMNPTIRLSINHLAITSPYPGFYNAYNVLAAVSMAMLLKIEDEVIQTALSQFKPQAGRVETFYVNGKKTVLVLVKNPTGLNQSLAMLLNDPAAKNLFIALNDNAADGRDISWIWDANLEIVADDAAGIKQIICSGVRSGDMAVRVKYAGYDSNRIIIKTGLKEGIETAVALESEVSYIFSTYTALFTCRKILVQLEHHGVRPERRSVPKPIDSDAANASGFQKEGHNG